MGKMVEVSCPYCGSHQSFPASEASEVDIKCTECGWRARVNGLSAGVPTMSVEDIRNRWAEALSEDVTQDMTLREAGRGTGSTSGVVLHEKRLGEDGQALDPPAEYELLELLGTGGMGLVYSARQNSVNRVIALKMIKPEACQDPARREKFLSEAAVTGELDHPNIVPVHDLGTSEEGQLFYAMKEVRGTSWAEVMREKTEQENLEILMRVADAVAFAHAKGIIHRDLKPSNVMLGEFGEVLVMDWGLAASVCDGGKAECLSGKVQTAGTPAYMPPEMAAGDGDQVGCHSDQYLLGAILYQIVTGQPPHSGDSTVDCLLNASWNVIQETEKTGELLDIARKAMATSPAQRYGSVKEFQEAIRLYQRHMESVTLTQRAWDQLDRAEDGGDYEQYARAVFGFEESLELWAGNTEARRGRLEASLAYARCAHRNGALDLATSLLEETDPHHADMLQRVRRSQEIRDARRRRVRTLKYGSGILGTVVFVLLAIGFVWIRAERQKAEEARTAEAKERRRAEQALVQARRQRESAVAARKAEARQRERAEAARRRAEKDREKALAANYRNLISLAASEIEDAAYKHARRLLAEAPPDHRKWEYYHLSHLARPALLTLRGHENGVTCVAFSPGGRRIATGSYDRSVKLWDARTGMEMRSLATGSVLSVAFSPDGRKLLTGGGDGEAQIWDVTAEAKPVVVASHEDRVVDVGFSRKGRQTFSVSQDGVAKLCEVQSGEVLLTLETGMSRLTAADLSPGADRIATAAADGRLSVWEVGSGERLRSIEGHRNAIPSVSFSPKGESLLTACKDGWARLWKIDTGELLWQSRFRDMGYTAIAFPPRGWRFAAAGGKFNTAGIYEMRTKKVRVLLAGHSEPISDLTFSPDRQRILTGSSDHTAKIWDAAESEECLVLSTHPGWATSVDFSSDGTRVVTGGRDRNARVWDAATGGELLVFSGHSDVVSSARFLPGGEHVVTGSDDGTARIWEASSGEEVLVLPGHSDRVHSVAVSPDGNRVVTAGGDNKARLWDARTGEELLTFRGHKAAVAAVAFAPDGERLLTASGDRTAKIWDASTGEEILTLAGHSGRVNAVRFSPDGRWALTGGNAGIARLWNSRSGEEVRTFDGHSHYVISLAFSPDGERILTGSVDGTAKLWDPVTGHELITFRRHPGHVAGVGFSPDGRRVVTAGGSQARIWESYDPDVPVAENERQRYLHWLRRHGLVDTDDGGGE